jgi:hypothetical protein
MFPLHSQQFARAGGMSRRVSGKHLDMVRRGVIAGVALLAALALAEASPSAATRPVLRLVDTEPFAVQGLRFDPGATVTVRVWSTGKTYAKETEVGARGRFTVRFPGMTARRCGTWVAVLATASDGSRAGLKLPGMECRTR